MECAWTCGTVAINATEALLIATKFLEQPPCVILADATLEGDEWMVTARTGAMMGQVKQVWVDAATGRILHCA